MRNLENGTSSGALSSMTDNHILLREGFKNYQCTFCRKFYKGGGGGSAVLQVLVRIFEKILKVLQML